MELRKKRVRGMSENTKEEQTKSGEAYKEQGMERE
jgi:hypothetical protein